MNLKKTLKIGLASLIALGAISTVPVVALSVNKTNSQPNNNNASINKAISNVFMSLSNDEIDNMIDTQFDKLSSNSSSLQQNYSYSQTETSQKKLVNVDPGQKLKNEKAKEAAKDFAKRMANNETSIDELYDLASKNGYNIKDEAGLQKIINEASKLNPNNNNNYASKKLEINYGRNFRTATLQEFTEDLRTAYIISYSAAAVATALAVGYWIAWAFPSAIAATAQAAALYTQAGILTKIYNDIYYWNNATYEKYKYEKIRDTKVVLFLGSVTSLIFTLRSAILAIRALIYSTGWASPAIYGLEIVINLIFDAIMPSFN